jgi:pimeloyl-ACP methyl ester carboxylesterase
MERVGIHDDFFDLGGHSLLAVRVIAEFEKLTGKRLPLTMLLQAPTIARLAELLWNDSRDPGWSSLAPIQTSGSKAPLFLAHEGNGSVMLYRQLARHLGEDQPVYGLQSQGLKGDGVLHRAVEEMASRYIQEVKRVQPCGPYHLGGYCLGGAIALEMALQLDAQGEKVALVVMIDSYNLSLIQQARLRRLQFLHMLQGAWFHLVNFASPKNVERWRFPQHKWEIARATLGIELRPWWDKLGGWGNPAKSGSDILLHVKKVNHQAMRDYVPRPYSGKVLLIRSRGHFWVQDDQMLGWGDGLCRQLEVRTNLARPKGIMLDPYLHMLAQDLKAYLEEVQIAETAVAPEPVEEEASRARAILDSDQMAKLMAGLHLAFLYGYLAFSM